MKLRTNHDSIRLRLNQKEVARFFEEGYVRETVRFSSLPNHQFEYTLIQTGDECISANFANNHLRIYVPEQMAQIWCGSDQVSMDGYQKIDPSSQLFILIEKDFKCLSSNPRLHEDESDNFPNPNKEKC